MPGTARFPGLDWRFDASGHVALAEAMGHAWIQRQTGGSVTLVQPANRHPWWPVLRAWLPSDAPLRIDGSAAATEPFPQRPFPPVELPCLARDGRPTWDPGLGIDRTLALIADQEPLLHVASAAPHPAIAVALAAIAGWGWRCAWHLPMWDAQDAGWQEALAHIGQRLLPLTLIIDGFPARPPTGWWLHRPQNTGETAAAIQWQLQHDWPGIIVPSAVPGPIPAGWLPVADS
jgi:hypothetical protein